MTDVLSTMEKNAPEKNGQSRFFPVFMDNFSCASLNFCASLHVALNAIVVL